ncbi:hypothetical protein [Methanorbis rubei]|uniref:Uncharacterized protein n=1 Tax=Methanorbis rubei TaxID=3028300 RepID=A0AAE4SD24_9EURY|nr:hypothetical protein [Methanocorpusculaceae archaeon Cs1]
MKPSRRYDLSLALNILLIAALCLLAFTALGTTPDQLLRDQMMRGEYPKEDYEAYQSSLDAGFFMSYETYLQKKYPVNFIDWKEQGQKISFLHLREVTKDEIDKNPEAVIKDLTGDELALYPLLDDLFIADTPFSLKQAYRYELEAVEPFTANNTYVLWHNKTYRLWEQEV